MGYPNLTACFMCRDLVYYVRSLNHWAQQSRLNKEIKMALSKSFVVISMMSIAATATLAQSSPQIDRTSWTLYRNDAFGFEVRYPGSWRVSLSRGSMRSVNLHAPQEVGKPDRLVQFIVQREINPDGLSIKQWYDEQLKKMKGKPPPSVDTVLGGRPTIRRVYSGTLGVNIDFYSSLNKTDVFQISIIQPSSQIQLDPIYTAILSTVKFLH
jgi:hypothetical protein